MAWQKGQSGNPGGKLKDKPLTEALRRKLLENDAKALNTIVNVWVAKAAAGDMQALSSLIDRMEGKPVQQVESHNVNENHYVRAPEKASKDDWQSYLAHKAKPATVSEKPASVNSNRTNGNGSSNGKSH